MADDRAFYELSSEKGYVEAFHHYIAGDGHALSGNGQPPSNKERYRKLIEYDQAHKPHEFRLTRDPIFSYMAESGELDFTHGRYASVSTNEAGEREEGYGYYISIWKRQKEGSWRFVLDGGNESPSVQTD